MTKNKFQGQALCLNNVTLPGYRDESVLFTKNRSYEYFQTNLYTYLAIDPECPEYLVLVSHENFRRFFVQLEDYCQNLDEAKELHPLFFVSSKLEWHSVISTTLEGYTLTVCKNAGGHLTSVRYFCTRSQIFVIESGNLCITTNPSKSLFINQDEWPFDKSVRMYLDENCRNIQKLEEL